MDHSSRRGWQVVEVYTDEGISGAKGRDKRPALEAMLNDASRRKFDVVMAWPIDRVGRSLIDLLSTIQHLEAAGVDLYLDDQNIDSTTPMGRLQANQMLAEGKGIIRTAKDCKLDTSTVHKLKRKMLAELAA